MQAVWGYCKSKMTCESDEPKDETEGAEQEEPKKGHGGCGAAQPLIRKEGLKLFVQYKRGKDEDEVRCSSVLRSTCLSSSRRSSPSIRTSGSSPLTKSTRRSRRLTKLIFTFLVFRLTTRDRSG